MVGDDQTMPNAWSCDISFLDEHAVMTVRGELDIATGPALLEAVASAIRRPVSRLSLDMAGVPFVDSSGVRALFTAQRAAAAQGVTLVLMSLPLQGRRVLEISGLADAFDAGPNVPLHD